MTAVLFVVAAAFGALVRHVVNGLGSGWRGTLVVNVVGAFTLGILIGSEASDTVATVFGTALLGSLTTFSSFALEASEGTVRHRITVVTATLSLGLAAGALGVAIV